jgi:hypothetical protein
VSRPAIQFIAPYQTVCNYLNYFIHPLGEAQSVVQSGPTGGGTSLNQNMKVPNSNQPNNYGSSTGSRPWDIPRARLRRRRRTSRAMTCSALYAPPYQPAIDAQGNADCQLGQNGYPNGRLNNGRYEIGDLHGPVRRPRPAQPVQGRQGRQRRDRAGRQQHPRPLRRHVRDAEARDQEPEGRAMSGRENGITPFRAGVLALVVVALFAYFGFSKANPFSNPYEFKAVFNDVNNLKPKSPVRIAGVEVGKVTKVAPSRAARARPR